MSGTTGPTFDFSFTARNIVFNGGSAQATEQYLAALAGGFGSGTTSTTSSGGNTSSGGTTSSGGSGTITPPPILTMPAGITGNMPVTIGSGPDTIILQLSYGDAQAVNAQFAVLFGGTDVAGVPVGASPVAAILTLTSTTYQAGGTPQVFTIQGNFADLVGTNGPQVVLQGAGTTLNNVSVQAVSYNFSPLVTQTTTDSRGTPNVNAASTWVSNGAPTVVFGLPVAVTTSGGGGGTATTEPTYTATPSTISGATINGTAAPAGTLQALVTATPSGGTLILPSGTFFGTAIVSVPMTIEGQGPQLVGPGATVNPGATIITCDQNGVLLEPTNDKGVFQAQVAGITFSAMTITGAVVNDNAGANAAGIRASGPGALGFTGNNLEICFCQDGILTDGGAVTLSNSYIHDNGCGAAKGDTTTSGQGLTHNLYFNGVAGDMTNIVTLTDVISIAGAFATHALKSRAMFTNVTGCTLQGNPSSDQNEPIAGSVMDTPNGGLVNVSTTSFTIPAGAANPIFYGYAIEATGASNNSAVPAGTPNVTMTSCTFNGNGIAGNIQNGTTVPAATLALVTDTYVGTAGAPTIAGFATVTGAITAAAA